MTTEALLMKQNLLLEEIIAELKRDRKKDALWMDIHEAMESLGCNKRVLAWLWRQGKLGRSKDGRTFRYLRADVHQLSSLIAQGKFVIPQYKEIYGND